VTAAQNELHDRVAGYLVEAFGELVKHAPGEPAFYVPLGRIGVRVEIEAVGAQNAIVECYCWIAQKVTVDDQVAALLARRNAGMRFCSLCVDAEGAIILRHALFAETVTEPILARLITLIASAADELDEELRNQFA
jgi:hypothetical protein